MDRNEKIALAASAAVFVGSAALFATSAIKANKLTKKLEQKLDTIKTVATVANTLTA